MKSFFLFSSILLIGFSLHAVASAQVNFEVGGQCSANCDCGEGEPVIACSGWTQKSECEQDCSAENPWVECNEPGKPAVTKYCKEVKPDERSLNEEILIQGH